jgi:hypothetical protein
MCKIGLWTATNNAWWLRFEEERLRLKTAEDNMFAEDYRSHAIWFLAENTYNAAKK